MSFPFDDLLGLGAADKLHAALDLTSVLPDSSVAVSEELLADGVTVMLRAVYEAEGTPEAVVLAVEYRASHANYLGLDVIEPLRGRGAYRQTVCAQSAALAEIGVPAMIASPADERSEYLLALGGFHWQTIADAFQFGTFTEGDRAGEYRDWIAAGRPEETEPTWHAELLAHPVPGPAVY